MIEPCLWGSAQWFLLHLLSFNYPSAPTNQDKNDMYSYLTSLGKVLPCPACRDHYLANINTKLNGYTLQESLASRDLFTRWMYELHNLVNTQTGKSAGPTFEQVQKKFGPLISGSGSSDSLGSGTSCSDSCSDESPYKCKVDIVPKNDIDHKMILLIIIGLLIMLLCGCGFYIYKGYGSIKKKY
jgi:hypothetical protein